MPSLAFAGLSNEPVDRVSPFNVPHSCNCGSRCNCLGCAAHPYNRRTMDFVQSLNRIMEENPAYLDSASPSVLSFEPLRRNGPDWNAGSQIMHSSWEPGQAADGCGQGAGRATSTVFADQSLPETSTTPTQVPSASANDNEDVSSESQVMLATDFFHVNYPRTGNCAGEDEDGNGKADAVCFCGDGCTCVGCIVHDRRHASDEEVPEEELSGTSSSKEVLQHPLDLRVGPLLESQELLASQPPYQHPHSRLTPPLLLLHDNSAF